MKVVIIGGAAGGASLATRLRRIAEKVQITIIEQSPSISYAACALPYYVGDEIHDKDSLYVANAKLLDSRYRVGVKDNTKAVSIDRKEKCVYVKNILRQSEKVYYDKLVIATGSRAFKPSFAENKEGVFCLKSVEEASLLKDYLKEHPVQEAIVVGGGFIGLETCENLTHLGIHVTLLEKAPQVLLPLDSEMAGYVHQELRNKGVKLFLNTGISSIEKDEEGLVALTDTGDKLKTQLVVMAAGVRANSEIAKDCGLEVDERGFIMVDKTLKTSDPDIYALGDVINLKGCDNEHYAKMALASPAQKQSRILAYNLVAQEGEEHHYEGALGTSIVRVLSLTAGSVGFNSALLKGRDEVGFVTVHAADHVSWYPTSHPVHLKLLFSKKDGRVLGAQAVGEHDVDKALEVVSMLMLKHGTVYDLVDFESAYAPPFSSPRSPVNMAGAAAVNQLEDLVHNISAQDLSSFDPENTVFLDVREEMEFNQGSIPGFINVKLCDLRVKIGMEELSKEKNYVVTCQIGVRGYIACCILKGCGFEHVYNLDGGYISWKNFEQNKLNH